MPEEDFKRKILYLSYDGLTDPLGQSQILPYLTGLSQSYSITIISFEKKTLLHSDRMLIKTLCEKYSIVWLSMFYHKKPPIISTLFDLFRLTLIVKRVHKKYNFDIIHCRSYLTSLVGLWMKRNYSVKFIFDMRGFWADERVDGGLWNLKNPLFKKVYTYFKKKEKLFINEADMIISLTYNAKHEILKWPGNNSPITIIPTCVDLELFDPDKITEDNKNEIRRTCGIRHNEFVLLYLGSWGTWYMTNEMLSFFSALKKIKPEARLMIISNDKVSLINFEYYQDVIVRKVARNEVPKYISIANASLFFIKPTYSKKASSATKMGEILAMNIPTVTNNGWGDIFKYENVVPCLYTVNCHNPNEFNQIIHNILNNITNTDSRTWVTSNLSLRQGIELYLSVYKKVISQ